MEDFQTWEYFPQLLIYQDFWSINKWIEGTLLYFELKGVMMACIIARFQEKCRNAS